MPTYEMIYDDLKNAYQELSNSQSQKKEVCRYIEQEKKDILKALKKFETGEFGKCEISGEWIPFEWIKQIPTMQTMDEWEKCFLTYGKKGIPWVKQIHNC
jgi:RNA polymerase-binding transcription factor DksA